MSDLGGADEREWPTRCPTCGTELASAVVDAGDCGLEPTTVVDWSEGYPDVVRVGAGDPSRFE